MIDYPAVYNSFMNGNLKPLYDNMYRGMMIHAVRLLGDDMAYMAEDCVQEAVMNTYENRRILESVDHWRNYMMMCVSNNVGLALRKRNSHSKYLTELAFENPQQENALALLRQETLDALYLAIDTLPEEYREIFRLSFEDGLKIKEIAQMLDIAEITVKKRKSRLIEMLRKRMGMSEADLILLLSLLTHHV